MKNLPAIQDVFDRRDFLKFQSLLMVWFYFLHGLGVNLFASGQKTPDYSLLDKLLEHPFSDEVMHEVKLRVELQKRYRFDANGELVGLDRFVREIINFIVSKRDFGDFKLLNSIKDKQINHTYMFNATARHNTAKQMKYMQKKLLGYQNHEMLSNALSYAIKTKSFDTTLHILHQKIKLDIKVQNELIKILQTEEYRHFYSDISQKRQNALPLIADNTHKRKTYKQISSGYEFEDSLYTSVYNSLRVWLEEEVISDFDLYIEDQKAHVKIWNYANAYPINFMRYFDTLLHQNGFGELSSNYAYNITTEKIHRLTQNDNPKEYKTIDIYDYLQVEIM